VDVDARLEAVEAENDLLRARIAQLEELLGFTMGAPLVFRLTASEARVFGSLMKRDMVTKEHVMAALYRDNARDEAEIKIVDVFICKIRKKIEAYGVEIDTVWGQGYRLRSEMKKLAESFYERPV
jgi:DNA-binding response OmpR family regulator